MSRLLEVDEVRGWWADLIEEALGDVLSEVLLDHPDTELRRWYHNMPLWILRYGPRALQVALVLDAGEVWVECSAHRDDPAALGRRFDPGVARVAVGELSLDTLGAALAPLVAEAS